MMHRLQMKLIQNKHVKLSADIKSEKARTATHTLHQEQQTQEEYEVQ